MSSPQVAVQKDNPDTRNSRVPHPDKHLSEHWLTKEEAAERLQTTTRTISRWIQERRIATRKGLSRRPGRKPLTVCDPVDIERLQSEMARAAVMPPEAEINRTAAANSVIAHIPQMVSQLAQAVAVSRTGPARPFMELNEAEGYSGLPRRLLLKLITDGRLPAMNWSKTHYVKKTDLDNLEMRPDAVRNVSTTGE